MQAEGAIGDADLLWRPEQNGNGLAEGSGASPGWTEKSTPDHFFAKVRNLCYRGSMGRTGQIASEGAASASVRQKIERRKILFESAVTH
jgi:hypothetical protein